MARFRTGDPHEARMRTQELLRCEHSMALLDRATPFLARVGHASMSGLGLMSLTYGTPVDIVCVPPIPWVTVSFSSRGPMAFADDGNAVEIEGPSTAAVLAYDRGVRIRMAPGTSHYMVAIERARIERYLRKLLGHDLHHPLRFSMALDLVGEGRGLAGAVATLRRAVTVAGGTGPSPVLAAEVEHSVISALLLGSRHNYTDAIFAAPPQPSARLVERVVEYVETSGDPAFTVADLAEFAGVSERSLHVAFRRRLGTSPIAYVRGVRLQRAHEELSRAEPNGGGTVTEIGLRYGFTNGGRFAAAYRARFGESPSETLRR